MEKYNITEFVLTLQFDVMFHLFRNSILISTHHKKLAPGAYYMMVATLSVGEPGKQTP